jgi:hypothetical protein
MNGNAVVERHYPKKSALEFRHGDPEAVPIPFLALNAQRLFDGPNAPLLSKIRAFPKDFVLEVGRELIVGHIIKIPHSVAIRAGDRTRTGDVQLGKLAFYQLNYARDFYIVSRVRMPCQAARP